MYNPKPIDDPKYHIPGQCIWLKMNGSWPFNHESNKDFYSSRNIWGWLYTFWSWYVVWSVGITIGFQTAFLIDNFGDIIMTTENCCTTFMGALNFVRLLHMRLHQSQFREIIEQFVQDIWISKWVWMSVFGVWMSVLSVFRLACFPFRDWIEIGWAENVT